MKFFSFSFDYTLNNYIVYDSVVMMTKNTPRDSGTSSGIYTPTSSETRIRSAYTLWCGQYNKTPDESRFATFSSNYLVMEQYAKENGKEMILNRYADCTEEEYFSITSGSVTVPSKAAERQSSVTAPAKETEEVKIKESSGKISPLNQSVSNSIFSVVSSKHNCYVNPEAAKVVKIAENKKTEANAKPGKYTIFIGAILRLCYSFANDFNSVEFKSIN